ncbi:MAG: lamin tail domain-containing protein [Bacteroidales bacterium]|jgi:hypothetical protein|nr:lamin tail domain-containing protein [Bacteroidales bacterium]
MKKLLLLIFILSTSSILFGQNTLFFSEYIDGSGNNKALEIYNPTDNTIDLSDYYVVRFSNGEKYPTSGDALSTSGGYLQLQGNLAAGQCWVIVNGQTETNEFSPACDPILQTKADQLDGDYPAPTYMNGNDAIALLYSTDGVNFSSIDLLGEIGLLSTMEEETGWSYVKDSVITYNTDGGAVTSTITDYVVKGSDDTGAATYGPYWMAWTKDHTLIRKPNITSGVTNNPHPFNVKAEWDTIPSVLQGDSMWVHTDIWSNLGTHEIDTSTATGFFDTKISKQEIRISPNPVKGNRFEIYSSDIKINSVEIYNIVGQAIYRKSDEVNEKYIINLNTPEKGIYLVKVNFENNNSLVKKIIIK